MLSLLPHQPFHIFLVLQNTRYVLVPTFYFLFFCVILGVRRCCSYTKRELGRRAPRAHSRKKERKEEREKKTRLKKENEKSPVMRKSLTPFLLYRTYFLPTLSSIYLLTPSACCVFCSFFSRVAVPPSDRIVLCTCPSARRRDHGAQQIIY